MIRHQPLGDPNATVAFAQNVSDLAKGPGSTITLQVNIANAPTIIGARTIFTYNPTFLYGTPQSGVRRLDYSRSIFGSSPTVFNDCIDGQSDSNPISGTCDPQDQTGSVDVFIATPSGKLLTAPVSGPLFAISFNVLSVGLSPLHFTSVEILNGTITSTIPVQSFDGYFSNKNCGTISVPFVCQPAIADFTMSPAVPIENTITHFNASASRSPNPGARITEYGWNWGGGTGSNNPTTSNPLVNQSFIVAGPRSVTLTVTDTFGVTGSKTIHIIVLNPIIDLAVGVLQADYQAVLPGQVVTISASVRNLGTRQENNTRLIITLDTGLTLANQTFPKLSPNSESPTITATWNTANYTPRAYRIDAVVPPEVNDTKPSNNKFSIYILVINPRPLIFFGLSLLQTAGIGILVVIGVTIARVVFKKQPEVAVGPAKG